jgi:hypothetical protein
MSTILTHVAMPIAATLALGMKRLPTGKNLNPMFNPVE